MVDVVSPSTMPSETEVHVARSFLTKILRSSMRYHPVSLCLAVFTGSFLVDLHGVRSLCFVFFCSSLMCMVLAVQVSLVYLHICVCHQFCDVGITRFYTYSALTWLACMFSCGLICCGKINVYDPFSTCSPGRTASRGTCMFDVSKITLWSCRFTFVESYLSRYWWCLK